MSPTARPHPGQSILAAYRRHRFAWLFASLLLTLAVGPTLDVEIPRFDPVQVLLAVNLLAALASVARAEQVRLWLLVLAAAFVVSHVVRAALGIPGIVAVSEAFWLAAIALATQAALRHAFRPGVVNAEHVLAALDAYLLAGMLFGVTYWMIDQMWPGSFSGVGATLSRAEGIYFSFVTMATLGYGDVVPVTGPARGLAMVEAVSGQMYLAVLVARLVSLYSRRAEG